MAGASVLVVEDAPEFAQLITAALRDDGYEVRTAASLADARTTLRSVPPDLVILDLTLPDGDGLDLCREIRESSDAFVLMLTGRTEEVDMLLGFRLGADDYMTKPFSARELAARVEALLRRRQPPGGTSADVREIVGLRIELDTRRVSADGEPVELTKIEFDLLAALSERPAAVRTRLQLMEEVWGEGYVGDDHVVDVHIANLRKKIDQQGAESRIRTVRGVGYGMNA